MYMSNGEIQKANTFHFLSSVRNTASDWKKQEVPSLLTPCLQRHSSSSSLCNIEDQVTKYRPSTRLRLWVSSRLFRLIFTNKSKEVINFEVIRLHSYVKKKQIYKILLPMCKNIPIRWSFGNSRIQKGSMCSCHMYLRKVYSRRSIILGSALFFIKIYRTVQNFNPKHTILIVQTIPIFKMRSGEKESAFLCRKYFLNTFVIRPWSRA